MGGAELPPALIHRVNHQTGTAIVSISRPPDTPGVFGTGNLVTLLFEGVAPGQSSLAFSQISARDSKRNPIIFQLNTATLTVTSGEKPD